MAGMSIFDCFSSVAYIFGSALTPVDEGICGANGNEATCKFQGWMLQLGLTALFFDIALSIYFYLVIVRNWMESHFRKVRYYVYGSMAFVGLLLAFLGIPHTAALWGYCYVTRPPLADTWIPLNVFLFVPVLLAVLVTTTMIVMLFRAVYLMEKKGRKWALNGRKNVTRKVFLSSFLYLLAVYISWPFVVFSWIYKGPLVENWWFRILVNYLSLSQGLWNSVVCFYRARLSSPASSAPSSPSSIQRWAGEWTSRSFQEGPVSSDMASPNDLGASIDEMRV